MDVWKKNFSISFVTPPQNNGWIVVLCIEKKNKSSRRFFNHNA